MLFFEWVMSLSGLSMPVWVRNIATAAVGALIAYTAWSWLHSPHLYPAKIVHQDIVVVDGDEKERSIRLEVKNIGTRVATTCAARLHLRVPTEDGVVRSFWELPWLPQHADLIVDDTEQQQRASIPAGMAFKLELLRRDENGKIEMFPQTGGNKFLITREGDEYHQPVDVEAEYAVLSNNGSRVSDHVRTRGNLKSNEWLEADWENSIVSVEIETDSGRPLMIDFDVEVNDGGELRFNRQPLDPSRRIVSLLYLQLHRLRGGR